MANVGIAVAAVAAITIASGGQAVAGVLDRGEAEYHSSCAPCHGSDGKAAGPFSAGGCHFLQVLPRQHSSSDVPAASDAGRLLRRKGQRMKAAMVAAGNKGGKRACTHPRPTDARHACRTDGSAAPYRKRTAPNLPDGSTELATRT